MTSASPTARSLAELRRRGYVCDVVERFYGGTRHDFLGFLDIIAVRQGETLGVQATSSSNVAARVTKVRSSQHFPALLAGGWGVSVWGWRKAGVRWVLREVACDSPLLTTALCNTGRHGSTTQT